MGVILAGTRGSWKHQGDCSAEARTVEETQNTTGQIAQRREEKREIPWHFLSPLHISPASACHRLNPMQNAISWYQTARVQTRAGEGREQI